MFVNWHIDTTTILSWMAFAQKLGINWMTQKFVCMAFGVVFGKKGGEKCNATNWIKSPP